MKCSRALLFVLLLPTIVSCSNSTSASDVDGADDVADGVTTMCEPRELAIGSLDGHWVLTLPTFTNTDATYNVEVVLQRDEQYPDHLIIESSIEVCAKGIPHARWIKIGR